MSDLVQFLLARIDDDEAAARESDTERWRGHVHDIDVSGWFDPARVLAECAAKREIVRVCSDFEAPPGPLYALANLYADHPDFEWGSSSFVNDA